MAAQKSPVRIIHTKFHRPIPGGDVISRPRIMAILDKGHNRPLTLICAPAGYGKSTTLSEWLATHKSPVAWLSLDEGDNDLRWFLIYLVESVRSVFPDACPEMTGMMEADSIPAPMTIAAVLAEELDRLGSRLTIALDDYHLINDSSVHELLSEFIRISGPEIHLVLATRYDPPLPLTTLRSHGQVTEIRMRELRFTLEEIAAFLELAVDTPLSDNEMETLNELSEGWITGLRLYAWSMSQQEDPGEHLSKLKPGNRYVMDYLVEEVLSKQPQSVRECLLTASIFDRFSPEMISTVCAPGIEAVDEDKAAGNIIGFLERANLFLIPLDNQRKWYRFHHLFQALLKRQLKLSKTAEEISMVYDRAADWFTSEGLIEEALQSMLKSGDPSSAARFLSETRHELMNLEQWHLLRRMLNMIPAEAAEKSPGLQLLKAWTLIGWPEMVVPVQRAGELVSSLREEDKEKRRLQGEHDTLLGLLHYAAASGEEAVTLARSALEKLDQDQVSERSFALIVLPVALQMVGDSAGGRAVIDEAMNTEVKHGIRMKTRLMATRCFLNWVDADLRGVLQTAGRYLKLGLDHNLPESIAHGRYFMGIGHYERNELAEAEEYLKPVVTGPFIANTHNYAHSAYALALCYSLTGRPDEARRVTESVINHAYDTGHMSLLQLTQAFQADLALRLGDTGEAEYWVRGFDPESDQATYRFYVPHLTAARILIAQDTLESKARAGELLGKLHELYSGTHNRIRLIRTLTLQAILADAQGQRDTALSSLEQALIEAQPGKLTRTFLDLGNPMSSLLRELVRKGIAVKAAGRVLAAFREQSSGLPVPAAEVPTVSGSSDFSMTDLSRRELEILTLMAQRLSNREIADRLIISDQTVKRHASNIYQKLYVNSRREAVERARTLGVLPGD